MQLKIVSRKKFTVLLCALGLISIVAIYPRQTVNFFYSTAVQVKDYIHFYGYRPVKSFAIRIPASYTIHGIDVSRWQERIDWQRVAKMRDNGIRLQFAFIKATEGEKLVDPYFSRNWLQSRKNGLLRGAYHYFSPSVAAPVQTRLFLQTVDFSPGDFPAVLDVEERGKLSAKELRKRVSQWLKMVEKNTGKKPIIYSGSVFYQENLAGYFNEYPWWIAHYYQRRPDSGSRLWRFWQHSDRGQVDGINGAVDFNVFNGSAEELQAFVEGTLKQ
ncbi:glycoside hydrolase family 25 protein [Escherichia albertii]|uniref:glycoside hydrolase family 25 protein n=1 Tax=Escherichia albertii TaxID=208962 RepID=UPI0002BBB764|nr:glycoside hydrolase family 25 protein [Escherichia albertii]